MNGFRFGSSALIVSSSASSARDDVGVEVELLNRPGRIVEDEEAELIEAGRASRCGPAEVGPSELAAGSRPAISRPVLRIHDEASRSARAVSTCAGRQARRPRRRPCTGARAGSNVQRAGSSMRPSFTPSERVARVDAPRDAAAARCGCEQARRLVVLQRLRDAHGLRRAAGPVEAGRAGDDAVEVRGEALRFLHRLASAGRAAVPVRELSAPSS